MPTITVHVEPGICGLKSVLTATCDDEETVRVKIESECPSIKAMEADLAELDGPSVTFAKFSASPVYQSAEKNFKHAACPVPAALVKAIEAACGMALTKDVAFRLSKG